MNIIKRRLLLGKKFTCLAASAILLSACAHSDPKYPISTEPTPQSSITPLQDGELAHFSSARSGESNTIVLSPIKGGAYQLIVVCSGDTSADSKARLENSGKNKGSFDSKVISLQCGPKGVRNVYSYQVASYSQWLQLHTAVNGPYTLEISISER